MVKVGPAFRAVAAVAVAGLVAASLAAATAGGVGGGGRRPAAGGAEARLIVQGPLVDVRSAVGAAGGRVTRELPVVGGVAAGAA